MTHSRNVLATVAGIAALCWGCARNQPVPVQGTPAAPSAVYGSVIVPVKKESATDGVLRVTNNTPEPVQIFLAAPNGDRFLRLIQSGDSESFQVPGKQPGETISLRAKTASGREYTSRELVTLSANACARNYGSPPTVPGCEWTVP